MVELVIFEYVKLGYIWRIIYCLVNYMCVVGLLCAFGMCCIGEKLFHVEY